MSVSNSLFGRNAAMGLLEEGGYKGGIRGPQKIPIFWGADDHLLALSKGGPPPCKKTLPELPGDRFMNY